MPCDQKRRRLQSRTKVGRGICSLATLRFCASRASPVGRGQRREDRGQEEEKHIASPQYQFNGNSTVLWRQRSGQGSGFRVAADYRFSHCNSCNNHHISVTSSRGCAPRQFATVSCHSKASNASLSSLPPGSTRFVNEPPPPPLHPSLLGIVCAAPSATRSANDDPRSGRAAPAANLP